MKSKDSLNEEASRLQFHPNSHYCFKICTSDLVEEEEGKRKIMDLTEICLKP
jgi:hypothetical protein